MNDQPVLKFKIEQAAPMSDVAPVNRAAPALDQLADLEVDMQNAVHCIRLRGGDETTVTSEAWRRAA